MLGWALGNPAEHSDYECQMDIGHSTGTVPFRMLIWALSIPAEHSEFQRSDWAFHRNNQISNVQMGIRPEHSDFQCSYGQLVFHGAFSYQMLRWALGIQPGHSDFECTD